MVPGPLCIAGYNAHMGGVNLANKNANIKAVDESLRNCS